MFRERTKKDKILAQQIATAQAHTFERYCDDDFKVAHDHNVMICFSDAMMRENKKTQEATILIDYINSKREVKLMYVTII